MDLLYETVRLNWEGWGTSEGLEEFFRGGFCREFGVVRTRLGG